MAFPCKGDPSENTDSKPRPYRNKSYFSITVLSLLDVFLIGVIAASVSYHSTEERDYLAYHVLPQFCVPCSDLALHPDDSHDGIVLSNNDTVCCAKDKSSIPRLVDKYSGRWIKELLHKENPEYHGCKEVTRLKDKLRNNPRKEFFKIQGYENMRLNDTHHRRVHWDTNSAIASGNMKYEHGFVTVGAKGMYQIYSQVVAGYSTRPRFSLGTPNLFMHAIVIKKNYDKAEERHIISSTLSQCETDPENRYSVSHIGTVFHISAGEKLAVKVSYPEDIQPNPNMNFFGIHMI